jgi:hypothetical protein
MNFEVQLDPFAPLTAAGPSAQELEAAWFDAPRPHRSPSFFSALAAPPSAPPPSIDDPAVDPWFR